MSHIKNICQLFQNYSRDELKKIDEQTGGLKGKESSRKLSNEEKQIQVASFAHLVSLYPYHADIEREGGALERTVEEGKSSKRGREREEERGRTRSKQKPQLLEDIIIILELKQQWQ